MEQVQPALDKGGVEVVLRARIGLLKGRLPAFAGRAKGRIHQHHVVAALAHIDEGKLGIETITILLR